MAEQSPHGPLGHEHKGEHETPGWVKVFGVILLAGAVLLVVLHLTGNTPGGH